MRTLSLCAALLVPVLAFGQAEPTKPAKPVKPGDKLEVQFKTDSGDAKLEALEAKLQELLAELKAMKASAQATWKLETTKPRIAATKEKIAEAVEGVVKPLAQSKAKIAVVEDVLKVVPHIEKDLIKVVPHIEKGVMWLGQQQGDGVYHYAHAKSGDGNSINLTRTTYTLPAEKVAALEAFLKAHSKASVLEIKSEGDKLTVTTTPDVQGTVAGMVSLMSGKSPEGALRYRYLLQPSQGGATIVKPAAPPAVAKPTLTAPVPAVPKPPKPPAAPKPPTPPSPPDQD